MFFLIVAAIINSANAQTTAPIQKPTVDQKVQPPDTGNASYEEYTDSDGNIKRRAFKYGFQYKDYKSAKPVGKSQQETYTKDSGDLSDRSFKYGFQYNGEEESAAPIKLKAPKLASPSESADNYSSPPPSSASSSPPTTANAFAPASDDLKKKDADILSKMKDLIKERQQLKAGTSN
jgi:flagellar motor protein MotB